jgi:hypothetical protein
MVGRRQTGRGKAAARRVDDATSFNREQQRCPELAIDGYDGTKERAKPGLHDAAGRIEHEEFSFTEEDGGGAARLRGGNG